MFAGDPAAAKTIRIVAFGDSLTVGFNLPASASFASALERRLRTERFDVDVVNAGVSGDTTADGLARVDWSVPDDVDLVIVELGANDMLRAIAPAVTRENLTKILEKLRDRKISTVLAGMRSLANWGEGYRSEFESIYPDLAARFSTPLYPFFLEGVTGRADLVLGDGMHPNAQGVETIVSGFAPFLKPVLMIRFGEPSLK